MEKIELRMRIIELEKALANSGCVHCKPEKAREVLGDPLECVRLGRRIEQLQDLDKR